MANILDYMKWRGDLPLCSGAPFNEVDGLIMARFSYLPFDKIEFTEEETVHSIAEKMKDFTDEDFKREGDRELMAALGADPRFRDLAVTDYVKDNNEAAERQFSAVTIHLSNKVCYLSFCGTDSTLLGWKEDFNLSFMENVSAQLAGLAYARMVTAKYPKKVRIGGHSKGGNIAVYSAVNLPASVQRRIIKVCNYDGPGFSRSFIDSHNYTAVIDRVYTFIPQDSVIGRILEHAESYEVVESTEHAINQHDIYSWQVEGNHMIKLPKTKDSSDLTYEYIRKLLENTTPDQRKFFIDGIYDFLTATSATTVAGVKAEMTKLIPSFFKTISAMPEEERKAFTEILQVFVTSYLSAIADESSERLSKAMPESVKRIFAGRDDDEKEKEKEDEPKQLQDPDMMVGATSIDHAAASGDPAAVPGDPAAT